MDPRIAWDASRRTYFSSTGQYPPDRVRTLWGSCHRHEQSPLKNPHSRYYCISHIIIKSTPFVGRELPLAVSDSPPTKPSHPFLDSCSPLDYEQAPFQYDAPKGTHPSHKGLRSCQKRRSSSLAEFISGCSESPFEQFSNGAYKWIAK